MEYLMIIVAGIFVNNIVLNQFLGICPFLGVSNKLENAIGMSAAVVFVMTLSTTATYLVNKYVLVTNNLSFMQTIVYILVIAALVQVVEIILKKTSPALYQALGVYLPLITTNCAILAVAILVVQKNFNLMQSVVFAIATSLGFSFALIVFSGIREQLDLVNIPKAMKGVPLSLLTAGLLSLAFMGFSGMVK